MRPAKVALGFFATLTAACTLVVSTSGLSGGGPDGGASSSVLGDAGGSAEAGSAADAAGDTGALPGADDPHLVGYWKFDETSGTTASDSSGHGHAITLVGASFDPGGKYGGAVALSGDAGAYVHADSLGASSFPPTGTISIWFLWSSMAVGDQNSIFSDWDNSIDHLFLRHANGTTVGLFQVALQEKGVDYVWETDFAVTKNSWTHVVVTWDQTAKVASVLVNGALQSRADYTAGFAPSDQPFRLGELLDGKLDELRLYDRPLSEGEASALP